jgi:hypothetical protein
MGIAMRSTRRRRRALALALTCVLALPACAAKDSLGSDEAGEETTQADDGTSASDAGSSSGESSSETTTSSSSQADTSSESGAAIDAACETAIAWPDPGFELDFGDRGSSFDGIAEWEGPCVVASVEEDVELVTVLDCQGGESGPTTVSLRVPLPARGAAWAAGDELIVRMLDMDWNGWMTLSMRHALDGALLATLIHQDPNHFAPEDFAPLQVTHDLAYCGYPGTGIGKYPILLTFLQPDGQERSVLQGGETTLAGLGEETWHVVVPVALAEPESNHNEAYVSMLLLRDGPG